MRPTDPTSTISTPTRTQYAARLDRLRKIAREAGFDTVALVPGPSLLYLTHVSYHLSERPIVLIVPAVGDPAMILPLLEVPKINDAAPFPIQQFGYSDADGYLPAFEQACKALSLDGKSIGVEGLKMRVLEAELIQRYARGAKLTSADSTIIRLRLHKDQDELASMRRAIKISEAGLEETLAEVKVGMTERQITNILLNRMAAHDGGGNAFDPIVLTGPKTAQPHGVPGDRVLQKGELLLFDFGSIVDGYPADITRTFFVGEPDAEMRRIYELVLAANAAGIAAIRPGVIAQDVDRTARKIITDGGYGEYFMHRLGHGLGLDVHEEPNIREGNTQKLEPGMVFTIEPGIYLPGKGGIRIEDNVVVTETGVEVLTSFPKAPRVISA